MIKQILELLKNNKIEYTGVISFSDCKITKKRLLLFEPKNAIIFLVPYFTKDFNKQNISHYAVSHDYHLYFNDIFRQVENEFPECNIKGFSDHSPIDEVNAAAKAGLGIIGENGLLINKTYGSYVFIGELFTDSDAPEITQYEIKRCNGCGACHVNCPSPDACLSALTQKKGILTDFEQQLLKKTPYIWGCDLCQSICPYNQSIKPTPIDFFRKEQLPYLDISSLNDMNESDFKLRAYSWRKREVILRNIKLINQELI